MKIFETLFFIQHNYRFPMRGVNQFPERVSDGVQSVGQWLGLTGIALNILGGILLLIIGYFIAKTIGKLVKNILHKTGIDKRSGTNVPISKFAGQLVYYLLMVVVLMATLSLMGVSGEVLYPLNEMTSKFFSAIPNIIAAGIIAYVGYFLAKIVADLIEASGDKIRSWIPYFSNIQDKNELDDNVTEINDDIKSLKSSVNQIDIVKILKNIAFIFVFIPILIIALEKLNMYVITDPATTMLGTFINAVPYIAYAIIILIVAVVGGKILSKILSELLNSFNINQLSQKLYINNVIGDANIVKIITNIVYIFIIYIGLIEASKQLGLSEVVNIMNELLVIAGKIIFGLLILAIGNVVANFATKIFISSEYSNKFSTAVVRGAIIVIFLAMGLHTMGIANEIIELSFGFGIGAIAVAFALAFGLGGKEAAGEEVKDFFSKLKKKDDSDKE